MSLTKITNGNANNLLRILGIYVNIRILSKRQHLNLVGNICFTLCLTPGNLKSSSTISLLNSQSVEIKKLQINVHNLSPLCVNTV